MKGFRLDRPADRWCLGCGLVLVLSLLLSDTVLREYVALTDAHPFAAHHLAGFLQDVVDAVAPVVGKALRSGCW